MAWKDENGKVPPGAMARATHQKSLLASLSPPGSQWSEQGPSNLAGRTRCLVINPTNPLGMWMGSAGGGVWRSFDGGTTWSPVGDQLQSMSVNALALDPNNANTLFAGTGEGYGNPDSLAGSGIFKSTDSGVTWNLLPSTSSFLHVNRIAIDPSNSQIILATVDPGGIYRSTDGGATWSLSFAAQSGHAVAFCPSNVTRVIGSIMDFDSNASTWYAAAVISTDTGKTWTRATGGLNELVGQGRIEPFPIVTDANTVYASVSDGNIWKSTDGGASYSIATTSGSTDVSLAANAIWVDPTNPMRLVVGGQLVYRSIDGGATLTVIAQGDIQTTAPHPGIHSIVASPAYDGSANKSVFFCTSGGVFEAIDVTNVSIGVGWLPRYQSARTALFNSVAGDLASGFILGGVQENGTQIMQQGIPQSSEISGGDGGFVAIDPTNVANMFGEAAYLQIFQSTDTGHTTQLITTGLTDASTNNSNYIAPLIIDPNNPKTLLAGGASLWRCYNAGSNSPTWTSIRPPGSAFISAISIATGNSNVIWVGQDDGAIAVTENGTAVSPTWTTVSGPTTSSAVPNRYVTRILVDPSNSSVVYVTLGGFTSNNVWETTDSGSTWNPIAGSGNFTLPQVPIRAIARQPGSPNSLYVGTDVGIFSTTDGGQTWSTSSDLNVNVSVDELTYINNSSKLLAATHGRGVWILTGGSVGISLLSLNPASVLGGTPSTGTITLSNAAPIGGAIINLSSNSADAQFPTSVFVPTAQSSVTFTVNTVGVTGTETVSIQASLGSSQKSASLTITPPTLSGILLNPTKVIGGNEVDGTVSMSGIAPTGGLTVSLSSSLSQAILPATVTVPAGSKTAKFTITTSGVAVAATSIISATLGGITATTPLTIQPAILQAISLFPASVVGGNSSSGTVALNGNAPFSGTVIKLSSNSKSAVVALAVTVPGGATFAVFKVSTAVVTKLTDAAITAAQGGANFTSTLQILPTALQAVTLSSPSVIGGSGTVVTGTVSFAGPVPGAGQTVLLSSSNGTVATVPASVRVPPGKSFATFVVSHLLVNSTQNVTIQALCAGFTQTVSLEVDPLQVLSLSTSPGTVNGGAAASGLVTLNARVGPRSGVVTVKLTSSTSAVRTPVSVRIASGSSTGKFNITTIPVASPITATLTASLGVGAQQTTLSVQPPMVSTVSVKPSTVKGGSTTKVVGTVTLTGAAPVGGLVVVLSSSDPSSASVPPSVTIPAGRLSATFTVSSKSVSLTTAVEITASVNESSKTGSLTVTP